METLYVDYQAWKYVYTVRLEVMFAGASGTSQISKTVVSDDELTESEAIDAAQESAEFDSISGSTGSSGTIVATLDARVVTVRIRVDV